MRSATGASALHVAARSTSTDVSLSGPLAGQAGPVWTAGLGGERAFASRVTLGAEIVVNQRGAELAVSDDFTSNYTISFATLGVASIARYYVPGPRRSFRPVVTAGVLLWKSISCSVDYDSSIGGGFLGSSDLTEGCDELDPNLSGEPSLLAGLGHSSGARLLLGLGLTDRRLGLELRYEPALGNGARATTTLFGFGSTVSLLARFYPAI
jgi:hypothetical protein